MRAFILDRRLFALAAMLLALSLRLALPGGVMPTFDDGRVGLAICHGTSAEPSSRSDGEYAAHDTPCAFSGLAFAALSGGDLGIAPPSPRIAQPAEPRALAAWQLIPHANLHPPAQGPPSIRSV